MLMGSVFLLALPFIATRSVLSNYFLLSALFVILFSLSFYFMNDDQAAIKQWLVRGEKHYRLQQEVDRLGGFAGIVNQIKKKLAVNPDDADGWFILGKLYLANQDYLEAKEALGKAHKLRPDDLQIKHFYDVASSTL